MTTKVNILIDGGFFWPCSVTARFENIKTKKP